MKITVPRLIAALVPTAVALFLLSGIPTFKDAHHGPDAVVGDVGWFGAQAVLLAAAALAVGALVRATRFGRRPSTR